MSSTFGVGDSAFRTVDNKTMLVDTIAFPAYTRNIVERVGLFDEELVRNQDDDYNYRLRKIGRRFCWHPMCARATTAAVQFVLSGDSISNTVIGRCG